MTPVVYEKENKERDLWDAYRKNPEDPHCLCALVEFYLPIVVNEVRMMAGRTGHAVEERELLGAGVVGLHSAVKGYAPQRNIPFHFYARPRIRGAVIEELRSRDPLSRRQRAMVRKLRRIVEDFMGQHGRIPSDAEISEQAGIPEDDVTRYLAMGSETTSLFDEYSEGLRHIDQLPDERVPSPRDAADLALSRERLRRAIRQLEVRDQQVILLRHYEGLSVQEIARVLGISIGRVSQLNASIILKLRTLMKSDTPMSTERRFRKGVKPVRRCN